MPDFGVKCMHGPLECAGNVHELCAVKHLEQSQWWNFLQCLNYQGRNKIGISDTAFQCAKVASFDWSDSGMAKCVGEDGSGKAEEGVQMLKESVQVSSKLGIK